MLEKSPPDCKNDGCWEVFYFGFYYGFDKFPNNPPLGALLVCDTFPNNPPDGALEGWVGLPNNPPLDPPGVLPEKNVDPPALLENKLELGPSYFLPPMFDPNNPPDAGLLLWRPPNVSFGAYSAVGLLLGTLPKRPPYFLYDVFNCELPAFENKLPPVPGTNKPPADDPNNDPLAGLFYVAPVALPKSEGVVLLLGFDVFLSVWLLNILPTLWTILKQINDLL